MKKGYDVNLKSELIVLFKVAGLMFFVSWCLYSQHEPISSWKRPAIQHALTGGKRASVPKKHIAQEKHPQESMQVGGSATKAACRRHFKARLSLLHNQCDAMKMGDYKDILFAKDWYTERLGFYACVLPKIGSTTWYQHMTRLGELMDKRLAKDTEKKVHLDKDIKNPRIHFNSVLFDDITAEDKLNATRMAEQVNIIFARNPFSRLASAFFHKFNSQKCRESYLRGDYGEGNITRKQFGIKVTNGCEISIPDFVDQLLRRRPERLNLHLIPQFIGCLPCSMKGVDAIVKMETFQEDLEFIFRKLGLSRHLNLDTHENDVTLKVNYNKEEKFFSKLSKREIVRLYDYYQKDFLLFGYNDTFRQFLDFGM